MIADTQIIWRDMSQSMRRFIGARVRDAHVADDLTQDVMMKVYSRMDSLTADDKLPAWMFRIARNAVIDHYRARRRHDSVDPDESPALESERGLPDVTSELACCLGRMVAQLPAKYREALELADLQGLSQQELADRTGVSLSGAKSRVQRGREQLKKMLLECCNFEQDARGGVIDVSPNQHAGDRCQDQSPCSDCE